MKALLIGSLLISSTGFAQEIDLNEFKNALIQNKETLEKIYPGMAKELVTNSQVQVDGGLCQFKQTAQQTVLKVEGAKIIIHSKESFVPEASEICKNAGYEKYEETILFYEDAPALANDLADLDASAKDIKSISKSQNIVTVNLSIVDTQEDEASTTHDLILKYDLTKPSFSHLVSQSGKNFSTTSHELPKVDVNSIDLSKVLFCESSDSDSSDCVEGDFSDILF